MANYVHSNFNKQTNTKDLLEHYISEDDRNRKKISVISNQEKEALDERVQALESLKKDAKRRKTCGNAFFGELHNVEPKTINFNELCGQDENWHQLSIRRQVSLLTKALKPKILLIDPTATYIRYWDLMLCFALFFVGTITPYEVAFLSSKLDAFFVINRIIDLIFLKDMLLQFVMKVEVKTATAKYWIRDPRSICRRYLRGGFLVDVISILPYDVFAMLIATSSNDPQANKLVKIVRLLRLLKLLRISRVRRIIIRYRDMCTWRFTYQALVKFLVLLATISHFVACIWGMIGMYLGTNLKCNGNMEYSLDGPADGVSWITAKSWPPDSPCVPAHVYVASLHFAVMTITSIGYGDIGPTRVEEYAVGVLCQILGGITWAYVIGSASTVLSVMNAHRAEFEAGMDALNCMLLEQKVKPALVYRMREYYREAEYHKKLGRSRRLSQEFSRELRAELTMAICVGQGINKVWYFKECPRDFVVELAQEVHAFLFAPGEVCAALIGFLCILERGSCAVAGRIYVAGAFWGEDMIINSAFLQDKTSAISLSFSEILGMSKSALNNTLKRHPEPAKQIRKAAVKIATWRAVKKVAGERKKGRRSAECERFHKLMEEAELQAESHTTSQTQQMRHIRRTSLPRADQRIYDEMQDVKNMVIEGFREIATKLKAGALPLDEVTLELPNDNCGAMDAQTQQENDQDRRSDIHDLADQLAWLSHKLTKLGARHSCNGPEGHS